MQQVTTLLRVVGSYWPTINVASVCMGLNRPVSNYTQQVTNKCQHCCGSMQTDAKYWAQQCCARARGATLKVGGGGGGGLTSDSKWGAENTLFSVIL